MKAIVGPKARRACSIPRFERISGCSSPAQRAAEGALISYEMPVQSDHRVGGICGSFLLPSTGSPGARSSGGCGLARPVVPGRVSLLAVLVSTPSSVVTNAARIVTITAIAKSTTEVRWLFHSLLMRGLHSYRNVIRLRLFPARQRGDGAGRRWNLTFRRLLRVVERDQLRTLQHDEMGLNAAGAAEDYSITSSP